MMYLQVWRWPCLVHHVFEMIFTLVRLDESSVVSKSGAIFAFESRLVLQVLNIRGV